MPLKSYFRGSGEKVYADMVKRYGSKRGKSVFYAVANERGMAPKRKVRRRKKR